jgi:murein DD-endopeptidase MepM/ murein hydrolase activator NlpD
MHRAAYLALFPVFILMFLPSRVGAEPLTITVQKGDTLYSIGREYRVSVKELIEENGILNPRQLKQGMKITVPNTHVVQSGDTLYSLARRNDTTVEKLCSLNDISPEALLQIGSVLLIPHDGSAVTQEGPRVAVESGAESDGETEPEGSEERDRRSSQAQETSRRKAVREERKKQDSQETTVRPARYEKGEKPAWPHDGERAELTGKLKGTEILGAKGDEIVAVASGRVVWVAPYRGYGKLVMIETANNMIYAYGGNEETYVDVGERVEAGTVIGSLGINPVEKNAKAFFFVYKDGQPVDPEKAPRG